MIVGQVAAALEVTGRPGVAESVVLAGVESVDVLLKLVAIEIHARVYGIAGGATDV